MKIKCNGWGKKPKNDNLHLSYFVAHVTTATDTALKHQDKLSIPMRGRRSLGPREPGAHAGSDPRCAARTGEQPDLRPREGEGARSASLGSPARLRHQPCALRQVNVSGAQLLSCRMGITERVQGVVARTK